MVTHPTCRGAMVQILQLETSPERPMPMRTGGLGELIQILKWRLVPETPQLVNQGLALGRKFPIVEPLD